MRHYKQRENAELKTVFFMHFLVAKWRGISLDLRRVHCCFSLFICNKDCRSGPDGIDINTSRRLLQFMRRNCIVPLATCPECDADIHVDEDMDKGDIVECDECEVRLEVVGLDPIELDVAPDDDDDDVDDDVDDDDY